MDNLSNCDISKIFSQKFFELSNIGGDIRRVFMLGQKLIQNNPEIDLIDLSLGNPDLEPPQEVIKAFQKIFSEKDTGNHRYMDFAGLVDVRKYLAKELSITEEISIDPNSVYLSVGAAGAIQILLRTFVKENDEVIVFQPYFPEYIAYIKNFYSLPVVVESNLMHEPKLEDLYNKISDKTKVIIINSPNNPSGILYSDTLLTGIINILEERFNKYGQIIHIISDEPYSRVLYEGVKSISILKMYRYSWVVRSFSKDLGLAGERIGYIAWRKELSDDRIINAFRNSARVLGFVSAPRFMQRILPLVYNAKVEVSAYQKRVESFIKILSSGGISAVKPVAGFFIFPKSPISDDVAYCESLVKQGVLCVPGSGFGAPGYFRASLTQGIGKIEEAAKRIVMFNKHCNNR